MVESIANIVRALPADRVRDGQPYVALELICGGAAGGREELEWSINVRCEPRSVAALDGAISAAYPDVRLGRAPRRHAHARAPGALRVPGYVMRFRKERSFVYSLIADGEELASPPLEQIARAQIAARAAVDRALPADPDPVVLRGARAAPATAGTRTSWCARSAGDCPRAGCGRRSTGRRCAPPSAPRTAACSGSRRWSPPTAARRARRSRPPCSRAAARTAFTAAG